MPDPIDKFEIIRELGRCVLALRPSISSPPATREVEAALHALRDRVIASTPEQLEHAITRSLEIAARAMVATEGTLGDALGASRIGTPAAGGGGDGVEHERPDDPPADVQPAARAGAQPVGGVQPAPDVDPARALQLIANLAAAAPGDSIRVELANALGSVGERSWMRARRYLREVETIALALASDAGELALVAERLAETDENDDVPF